jgi:hypothetical protein
MARSAVTAGGNGPRRGRGRALLVLLLLYVALDVCNPFIPGVFEFSPADSVDAWLQPRAHGSAPLAVTVEPVVGAPADPAVVAALRVDARAVAGSRPAGWRPVGRSRTDVRESSPPGTDEH